MARIMKEEDRKFFSFIELFIHTNADRHMRRLKHIHNLVQEMKSEHWVPKIKQSIICR